jgi:hypothetical protein
MLALLANWRIMAAASAVALALGGWAYVSHLQRSAAHAKAETHAAVQQSATDQAAVKAVDHYTEHTTIIHERADHAVQSVQSAPGAETLLDPARRAILCAALGSVRGDPVCTDPDDPADPSASLHRPEKPYADAG